MREIFSDGSTERAILDWLARWDATRAELRAQAMGDVGPEIDRLIAAGFVTETDGVLHKI